VGLRKIELLSPARDLECGIAAIDHGADAVYIGAAKYGARAEASNSIADIKQLVNYAHLFSARVYLTINTILFENEIEDAVKLAWDGYHSGVDALIIQDMGLLECNLPPLPLHASTQTNNRTAEKAVFLEKVGFSQIVLARELNLTQIEDIHKQCGASLEFFIHGALCTCYSGQCYLSYNATGRSGNRGECAQMCRHKYSLYDSNGKLVLNNKYLLSLKDLNLTDKIEDLINAGISSFKIEGRLKDPEYVKNITSHYRRKLDEVISKRTDMERSSIGISIINFEPRPEKTFNRFFSTYFINVKKNQKIANIQSPKSVGDKMGIVIEKGDGWLVIDTAESLTNGDGLCFFDKTGDLHGFRANKVEGKKIYTMHGISIPKDTKIYRNKDIQFEDLLGKSTSCRKIDVNLKLSETKNGICLRITDEQGVSSEVIRETEKQAAKDPDKQANLIKQQLSKLGESIYTPGKIDISFSSPLFIPSKVLNEIRRDAILSLNQKRLVSYRREERKTEPNSFPYFNKTATYRENISNSKAENFYRRHGVKELEKAFELQPKISGQLLMTTKYCVRNELELCLSKKRSNQVMFAEPLFLEDNTGKYRVEFDCKECQMNIYST
jgi:23S rRNA 5-hydroxycytidine C2501 synthase